MPDLRGPTRMVADADLARFAEIAEELGDGTTALEARQEAARLVDGCFYVACVGQFSGASPRSSTRSSPVTSCPSA